MLQNKFKITGIARVNYKENFEFSLHSECILKNDPKKGLMPTQILEVKSGNNYKPYFNHCRYNYSPNKSNGRQEGMIYIHDSRNYNKNEVDRKMHVEVTCGLKGIVHEFNLSEVKNQTELFDEDNNFVIIGVGNTEWKSEQDVETHKMRYRVQDKYTTQESKKAYKVQTGKVLKEEYRTAYSNKNLLYTCTIPAYCRDSMGREVLTEKNKDFVRILEPMTVSWVRNPFYGKTPILLFFVMRPSELNRCFYGSIDIYGFRIPESNWTPATLESRYAELIRLAQNDTEFLAFLEEKKSQAEVIYPEVTVPVCND